jgi:hypothetical protein
MVIDAPSTSVARRDDMMRSILHARYTVVASLIALGAAACATAIEDDEDEDEDAESAGTGKADADGLPFGAYVTVNDEHAHGDPVLAVLHPPDGSELPGETGQFDLVRYRGAAGETSYERGTFRQYRYAGRDRIRFSTSDGQVIARMDWAYQDGVLALGGGELVRPHVFADEIADCLAVEVLDTTALGDSLSPIFDPKVAVDQVADDDYALYVGALTFASSDAVIEVADHAAGIEARATYFDEDDTLIVRVPAAHPRRGELLSVRGDGATAVIARLVCR